MRSIPLKFTKLKNDSRMDPVGRERKRCNYNMGNKVSLTIHLELKNE